MRESSVSLESSSHSMISMNCEPACLRRLSKKPMEFLRVPGVYITLGCQRSKGVNVKRTILFLVAAVAVNAYAGEGMWMPQQVPQLAPQLRSMGLKIDPAKLADLTGDPLGAVIALPGCTAAFVSPDGLIVTNHHCAFGSIQQNSTAERDLIATGFVARTRDQELPAAPGTKVWVTTRIEDVTDRVSGNVPAKLNDADRERLLAKREKELIAECEKPGGLRCKVSSFFEGSQYLRTTQLELSDIKLVYAPARSVGEYGGEVDNFE